MSFCALLWVIFVEIFIKKSIQVPHKSNVGNLIKIAEIIPLLEKYLEIH